MNILKRLVVEEEAQGLVEYILIIAVIAVLAITILKVFGEKIKGWFNETGENLDEAF